VHVGKVQVIEERGVDYRDGGGMKIGKKLTTEDTEGRKLTYRDMRDEKERGRKLQKDISQRRGDAEAQSKEKM